MLVQVSPRVEENAAEKQHALGALVKRHDTEAIEVRRTSEGIESLAALGVAATILCSASLIFLGVCKVLEFFGK